MTRDGGNSSHKEAGRPPAKLDTSHGLARKPADTRARASLLAWFDDMVNHCLEHATDCRANGHPVVGIMCEYTPRELILAVGGVPVCLCGGSAKTISAAEEDLPANLCPLIKSTYGFHKLKTNPFLEMMDLIVAETTCDGKKKMFELMSGSRSMYVLELPHKSGDPDARDHWLHELHKFKRFLETRYRTRITEDRLRSAIELMNNERRLRRSLAELMQADLPPLSGLELLNLKSLISGLPADLAQYQAALRFLPTAPPRSDLAGRVRVLLTGVPLVHGAERVLEIIEGCGGLVVCQENCTGLKPILAEPNAAQAEPMEALADHYFHLPCSVQTPNDDRMRRLVQLARAYRPRCVIEIVWQACLTYAVESHRVRKLAEEELGLPYLRIETDYSPSDSGRIAVRIQALFEIIQGQPDPPPAGKPHASHCL